MVSKYRYIYIIFRVFLNHPSEHQFLGVSHPGTRVVYIYDRLPMGTCNSPGVFGQFGTAFVRIVSDSSPVFRRSKGPYNSILLFQNHKSSYSRTGPSHDQRRWLTFRSLVVICWRYHILGEGQVVISADGLPFVLLWLHVDDTLIHGLSKSKLVTALKCILDTALTIGLICHSNKTVLPTQKNKFCCFIYNTQDTLYMTIPSKKLFRPSPQSSTSNMGGTLSSRVCWWVWWLVSFNLSFLLRHATSDLTSSSHYTKFSSTPRPMNLQAAKSCISVQFF